MALPTNVTTSSISRLSGSSRRPNSTWRSPSGSQDSAVARTGGASLNNTNTPQLSRSASTTAVMESCALTLPSR